MYTVYCGDVMCMNKHCVGHVSIYVDVSDVCVFVLFFFFQAEDGIRDLVRSRGLGDVYKRQFGRRASHTQS